MSYSCPRCEEGELNEELSCPICGESYFKQEGKLLREDVDSPIYQPKEGHPDVCDCKRREDEEIIWTDGCLDDGFVEWQKDEEQRRGDK